MKDLPKLEDLALLTDLYELTMLQGYWREGMHDEAVFSLYFRELPESRNFILACGLGPVLDYLESARFSDQGLEYLGSREEFRPDFIEWLRDFRFEVDVYALPEGTPFFPNEPVLEVVGPLPQAQLAESFIMNQIHFQSVLASKAARVVYAAGERAVVDFGLRRMHGIDAGLKAARAFHIAGTTATSHVLAGQFYDIPITGTMAHSYIQAHDDELEAFRAFSELYPETVLLVDTYDTLAGVRKVVELAREQGDHFSVRAIRLDSGDLVKLASESRRLLDEEGLEDVEIFASGGLDEYKIDEIVKRSAPISGFGVGTRMGVSKDAPSLDMAYKLTRYAGAGRLKLSSGKKVLPGRKQVFRIEEEGQATHDVIAMAQEEQEGRPLLHRVMKGGQRTEKGRTSLEESRRLAREEMEKLPRHIRALGKADPPYPVEVSKALEEHQQQVARQIREDS